MKANEAQYLISMDIVMTIKADEFKLAQMLSKFSEDYRANYTLKRQTDNGFILHLTTDYFGELVRRLNHIKGCSFKIIELRGGRKMIINVDLMKTNVDALIGKSTITSTDIDPVSGGMIKLGGGELWSCRPRNGKIIKANARVKVFGVEGVRLIVEEVK
jgi:hypothetical protein